MAVSCAQQKEDSGYIGPSDIQITDGVMTPETLLSLGRLSDPQLSPDGSRILYGVSYGMHSPGWSNSSSPTTSMNTMPSRT